MAGAVSPSFPKGLRVLLVDDHHSKNVVAAQLQQPELQYAVTSVTSSAEALNYQRTGVAAFDVVLAESRVVAADESLGRAFIEAFEDTPVVLMSECGTTEDVLRAVKLGAVDFLDKPLSLLKLKNIWQHSVRKMMAKAAGPQADRCPLAAEAPSLAQHPPSSWGAGGAAMLDPCMSLGPESPGTPSASIDLAEAFSMGSMSQGEASVGGSARSSFDCCQSESFMDAMNSALHQHQQPASAAASPAALSRPSSLGSLPAVPCTSGSAAGSSITHWPALQPGCVWGTPANGPVPPPLTVAAPTAAAPAAAWATAPVLQPAAPEPAAVLIKSCSSCLLPGPASTDCPMIPDGFLSDDFFFGKKSSTGPLGLKLNKSPSLLNLINNTLCQEDPLNGLCDMSF